ncbi:MAG: MaoC/PaaZ C-terminal domain-containing protein [Mycobacterium sp.]
MVPGCYYEQLEWADIAVGDELPEVTDHVSFTRIAAAPAATLDYFPVHHDREWAQASGLPDIVMSTLQIAGFVDRVVTQWAGSATFISRRKIRLATPVHPNDTIIGAGRVVAKRIDDEADGRHLVDVEVVVRNQRGDVCCPAELTINLTPAAPPA